MLMRRKGSRRDSGWARIFEKDTPKIEWDKQSKSVRLSVSNIREQNTGNMYNYDVLLSIDDVQRILESLAEEGVADSQKEISQKFSSRIDKLLKIMMCCVGVVTQRSGSATKTA